MIEKAHKKAESFESARISLDLNKNPYISRLTFKIFPPPHLQTTQFISPFSPNHNMAITQSLALYNNKKFRLSLLWNQQISKNYSLTLFGTNAQYRLNDEWLFKVKGYFANEFLCTSEVQRSIKMEGKSPITLFFQHSCFRQSDTTLYHTVGTGVQFNSFNCSLIHRLDLQNNLFFTYEKAVFKDLYLKLEGTFQTQQLKETALSFSLGYYYTNNTSVWLKNYTNLWDIENKVSFEITHKTPIGEFIGNIQFESQKSIIYLGYKSPSFNFVFPAFFTDHPLPILCAGAAYVLGYFIKKKSKAKVYEEKKKKTLDMREKQMNLINEKASEIYDKELAANGLLIEEVYLGEKIILQEFLRLPERGVELNRVKKYQQEISDLTVTFRFYVQKGKLTLPKGSKEKLLGVVEKEGKEVRERMIFIRYKKNREQKQAKFYDFDPINL